MLLSALVEAAGTSAPVDDLPARLGLGNVTLEWNAGRPGGFAARQLEVVFDKTEHDCRRDLTDVEGTIRSADLVETTKDRAIAVFRRLAEAEAQVHGATVDTVHFHEVGAVDALVDIVGCCAVFEELGVDEVICSPLPMGHGTVECAHGVLPLPAPAVAAMLPEVPVYDAKVEGETVTPTGAALVTTLSDRFSAMPAMTVEAVGIGAGSRQYPNLPNLVRVFVGQATESTPETSTTEFRVVECNVDDLDPRVLPVVIDRLLDAGAVDAYVTSIVMKKGRPGFLLSALAPPGQVETVMQSMLRETTTLGCRVLAASKHMLNRRMESVETPWGQVQVKVASLGRTVLRREPEFDDCAEIAERTGIPVRQVLETARSAAIQAAGENTGQKEEESE
jgi:uncharacterized protein (TIGR00299 family) protein